MSRATKNCFNYLLVFIEALLKFKAYNKSLIQSIFNLQQFTILCRYSPVWIGIIVQDLE